MENRIKAWIEYLLIGTLLVPFFIRYTMVDYVPERFGLLLLSDIKYIDLFTKIKADYLITLSIVLALFFIFYLYKKKNIPILLNDFFVVLLAIILISSTFKSEYLSTSLYGIPSRFDGLIFYLILLLLLLIIRKVKPSDNLINSFDLIMFVFLILNVLMGLVYYMGINLLEYSAFLNFLGADDFTMDISGFLLGTIENPNYFSGFSAFLWVYYTLKYLLSKKNSLKFFGGSILSLILLLMSISNSGYFSVLLSIPFILVVMYKLYNKDIFCNFIKIIAVSVVTIICLSVFEPIRTEIISFFNLIARYTWQILLYYLMVIIFVIFIYGTTEKKSNSKINKVKVIFFGVLLFSIFIIWFSLEIPEKYVLENKEIGELILQAQELDVDKPRAISELSGREHIWWYTLSKIKEKPILGYGLGTLVYEFPNLSIDKYTLMGDVIVQKPHSNYLEIFYGSGMLGLFLWCVLFLNIFIDSLLFVGKMNSHSIEVLPMFGSFLVFLFQGIVNDSTVSTYSVMIILIGYMCSKIEEEKLE